MISEVDELKAQLAQAESDGEDHCKTIAALESQLAERDAEIERLKREVVSRNFDRKSQVTCVRMQPVVDAARAWSDVDLKADGAMGKLVWASEQLNKAVDTYHKEG